MRRNARGRPAGAALFVCIIALGAQSEAATLLVTGPDGTALLRESVAEGDEWCLSWQHSVTGGDVADCFVLRGGHMVLDRSYLHDFAAGLGTVQGRGRLVSAPGGGYWIEDMDDPIAGDALPLRVGRGAVDHRLRVHDTIYRLSDMAAGRRVTLRLGEADERTATRQGHR